MTTIEKQKILDCIAPSVKSQLKAPLTAVFCSPEELRVYSTGDSTYSVEGLVNSQNSYGAMISTDFSGTVRAYDDHYSVIQCTVGKKQAVQQAKQSANHWLWAIVSTLALTAIFYFIYSAWLGI